MSAKTEDFADTALFKTAIIKCAERVKAGEKLTEAMMEEELLSAKSYFNLMAKNVLEGSELGQAFLDEAFDMYCDTVNA